MAENGNGKWQLAFWIVTLVCGVWLSGLSSVVAANDRARISEDSKITRLIYDSLVVIREDVSELKTKFIYLEKGTQ